MVRRTGGDACLHALIGNLGVVPRGPLEDGGDDAGDMSGGWVPPEARTWRHPSELRAAQMAVAFATSTRLRRGTTALIATTGLLAIVVGAALLVSTGSTPGTATLTTMPVHAAVTRCCTLTTAATRDVESAVVSLEPASPRTATTIGCGVVVGEGLVATTQLALEGRRRLRMVSPEGSIVDAVVVATDPESGIALLRATTTLSATPAIAGSDAIAGAQAVAVAMRMNDPSRLPRPVWTSGTILSVGTAAPEASKARAGMAEITVRDPSLPELPGEPLVDKRGRILGILDGGQGAERWFLPMSLVSGVSVDLETIGTVRHGWLGVAIVTPPSGVAGAEIVSVDPSGAAAKVLQAGDVVERLDGVRVESSAQLRSMLYVMSPGSDVTLEAVHDGHAHTVVVQLESSP